jgi:small subunit ribosomal protein S20
MRQTKVRTAVNRAQRSALRSAVKKAKAVTGTAEERKAALLEAERLLDRAGRKNLVHKNTAARTKSRLQKGVKA